MSILIGIVHYNQGDGKMNVDGIRDVEDVLVEVPSDDSMFLSEVPVKLRMQKWSLVQLYWMKSVIAESTSDIADALLDSYTFVHIKRCLLVTPRIKKL